MDWASLTALGGVQAFPSLGINALFFVLLFTGRIQPASSTVREIDRAQSQADKVVADVREDRDARLESKNAEIARISAAQEIQVERLLNEVRQWREAWRESQDVAAEVRAQNRELIDSLYFVRKIVGALPRPGGGEDE